MDKSDYITSLFNNIKDDIEFDSDIIALNSLLNAMLNLNVLKSFNNWKYIIDKYEIQKLGLDIDFTPLYIDYLVNLIKKIGFKEFFVLFESVLINKRKIIYSSLFNIYDNNCFLFVYIRNLINKNWLKEEKEFINLIIKESISFSKETFDKTEFLKKIIIMHINNNKVNSKFLEDLTNMPETSKERAILKALLIDYF